MTRCIACASRLRPWTRAGRWGAFGWHTPRCPGEQLINRYQPRSISSLSDSEQRLATIYARQGRLVLRRTAAKELR